MFAAETVRGCGIAIGAPAPVRGGFSPSFAPRRARINSADGLWSARDGLPVAAPGLFSTPQRGHSAPDITLFVADKGMSATERRPSRASTGPANEQRSHSTLEKGPTGADKS